MATSKAAPRADADADVRADVRLALRKRRRPHETLIQGLLFLCGAVSILTTLSIAFGLVQESLSFFTRELWEDANKRLVAEVDAHAGTLQLSSVGLALEPGAVIKIEDLMSQLAQDYTIIVVTHNMQRAARVSDYTAFFMMDEDRAGYLVEHGPTNELFTNPKDQRTEDYITGRFG